MIDLGEPLFRTLGRFSEDERFSVARRLLSSISNKMIIGYQINSRLMTGMEELGNVGSAIKESAGGHIGGW